MSRKRSRKVLYEVSSEVKNARNSRPKLEIFKRAKAFAKKITSGRAVDIKEKASIKPSSKKSKIIAIAGKLFNFSIKKALILLAILAAIVIFGPFGKEKANDSVDTDTTGLVGSPGESTGSGGTIEPTGTVNPDDGTEGYTEDSGGTVVAEGPPKDHCIVIASHDDLDQLKALAGHFLINGIETKINKGDSRHTLITKEKFYKPGDPQSDIEQAKAKIKQVGDKYKPDYSSGYLRFKFDGIYADKVE